MSRRHRWNRRQWIWTAAVATGAAAVLPRRSFASPGRVLGSPAVGPVHEAVDTKLKAFPLSQVRLRPGSFLDQLESNQSFIESLPNDRLLHTFRLTAGITSSAARWVDGNILAANCADILPADMCCRPARCCPRRRATTPSSKKEMCWSRSWRSANKTESGWLPQRVSNELLRPLKGREARVGALLYLSQNSGRSFWICTRFAETSRLYADDYHWRDGIGPLEARPKRVNIHWGGYPEDGSFGTHEFIGLCRLIGENHLLRAMWAAARRAKCATGLSTATCHREVRLPRNA